MKGHLIYLMTLILEDGLDCHNFTSSQITCSANNSKGSVANDIQVAEAKGLQLIVGQSTVDRYRLIPNLLNYNAGRDKLLACNTELKGGLYRILGGSRRTHSSGKCVKVSGKGRDVL